MLMEWNDLCECIVQAVFDRHVITVSSLHPIFCLLPAENMMLHWSQLIILIQKCCWRWCGLDSRGDYWKCWHLAGWCIHSNTCCN